MVKLLATGATCTRRTAPGSVRGIWVARHRCRRARPEAYQLARTVLPSPSPGRSALGARPARSRRRGDRQRDVEVRRPGQGGLGEAEALVLLPRRHLDEALVVDLEHQAAAQLLRLEVAVEAHQGHLEDVRGQSLNAGVHGL